MQDNDVKENFSDGFVRLLMAKNRLKVHKPESDDGVDLNVAPIDKNTRADGKFTYSDSDRFLGIQLKCTTEKKVKKKKNGNYTYDLRVKNYEDLIRSKEKKPRYKELILVVFILPENEVDWFNIYDDYIHLSKNAFWYYPSDNDSLAKTASKDINSTIAIEIKAINKLDLDFMSIYNSFYGD